MPKHAVQQVRMQQQAHVVDVDVETHTCSLCERTASHKVVGLTMEEQHVRPLYASVCCGHFRGLFGEGVGCPDERYHDS